MIICRRELIHRHDSDPYLLRFILLKCRWCSIMLHHFLASDDECLHDHPWPFLSLILWGGYWETLGYGWMTYLDGQRLVQMPRQWHPMGTILFRRADVAHRIEIDPSRPAWSLVITGPRVRLWGFFTHFGWLPWFSYRYREHCS